MGRQSQQNIIWGYNILQQITYNKLTNLERFFFDLRESTAETVTAAASILIGIENKVIRFNGTYNKLVFQKKGTHIFIS